MNTADDPKPSKDTLPKDPDLGPEPDWLSDDVIDADSAEQAWAPVGSVDGDGQEDSLDAIPAPAGQDPQPSHDEEDVPVEAPAPPPPSREELEETTEFVFEPATAIVPTAAQGEIADRDKKSHPWLLGFTPLILLLALGLISWFSTTQILNGLGTWDAIRTQNPPLLPARWAMTIWWAVLPLMAIFLIYGTLPAGREVTRIRVTGPLISISLVATALWIFAQHWQWEVIGIVSMAVAAIAILVSYFLVALNPEIRNFRQRLLAMIPLSAALAYSVLLTVLSWQNYSSQPFGERGSTVLFTLLVVVMAAIFAFFLRDGLFSFVLAIWFAGIVHQQWGEDAVISLVAAVAVLFTGALAALGTILAMESHRPSLTASVESGRSRISFFRKSENPKPEDLP